MIENHPRVMGQSPDGLSMLEIVGIPADLTKVTIIVGLPSDNAHVSDLNRTYMLKLLQHLFLTKHQAPDWLTESTLQLTNGYTGDLITIRDNKRIKPSAIGALSTLVLVIEPD